MWFKEYKDYKIDDPLAKERVSAETKSIVGCQMQDLNGWGEEYHTTHKRSKKGVIATLLERFFFLF